jgi:cytochrome c-type biogenesis protein CcmE
MIWLYLRWGAVALAGLVIASIAAERYAVEVRPITPEVLLRDRPEGTVRVIGMVQPGSLSFLTHGLGEAKTVVGFELAGRLEHLPVSYSGPTDDNLRELKTLVVVGRLDNTSGLFESDRIDLIPNYGFVTAAYLVALLPLALFLFLMERRVAVLYTVTKATTAYTPEVEGSEQG